MSVDFHWLFLAVPPDLERLARDVIDGSRPPRLQTPTVAKALRAWKSKAGSPPLETFDFDSFTNAFWHPLETFQAVLDLLGHRNSLEQAQLLNIAMNRVTPPSVLYYALGQRHACALPGSLGTMIVGQGEVSKTLESVQAILGSVDATIFQERADAVLDLQHSNSSRGRSQHLLRAIPDMLERASRMRTAAVALCFDASGRG